MFLKPQKEFKAIRNPLTPREKIENMTFIKYKIQVADYSYLHMGTGLVRPDPNNDITGLDYIKDSKGNPIIPGSSLKGYCRNNYETLVIGCCFLDFDRRSPVSPCTKENLKQGNEGVCPACNLFGMNGLMARISFSDAICYDFKGDVILNIPRLMNPNIKKYVDKTKKVYKFIKFNEDKLKSKKDYIWAIRPQSKFEGTIQIINLNKDKKELQKIIHSFFNFYKDLTLILGHGKNIGLGHCRLISLSIKQIDINNIFEKPEERNINLNLINNSNDVEFGRRSLSNDEFRWDILETIHQTEGEPYPE